MKPFQVQMIIKYLVKIFFSTHKSSNTTNRGIILHINFISSNQPIINIQSQHSNVKKKIAIRQKSKTKTKKPKKKNLNITVKLY